MTEKIRAALEAHLNSMPAISTAWENANFDPVIGTPYQRVNMLYAEPNDLTMGATRRREIGIFQITLCYPEGNGSVSAHDRFDLVVTHFKRGTVLSFSGANVLITKTPRKTTLGNIDGFYTVIASISYSSDIFN